MSITVDPLASIPAPYIALYGTLATGIIGLIAQWIAAKDRARIASEVAKLRELDIEEKLATRVELIKNTELTRQGVNDAKLAYTEANNVNAKIAALQDVQAKLLASGHDPTRVAELTDYVHARLHDLSNHLTGLASDLKKP